MVVYFRFEVFPSNANVFQNSSFMRAVHVSNSRGRNTMDQNDFIRRTSKHNSKSKCPREFALDVTNESLANFYKDYYLVSSTEKPKAQVSYVKNIAKNSVSIEYNILNFVLNNCENISMLYVYNENVNLFLTNDKWKSSLNIYYNI